jgi:hypothetical protein
MILPNPRDPRFTTVRRGGTLTDADHRLLALWAGACAGHVLPLFEASRPGDDRPRRAIEQTTAWVRGEITMTQARAAAFHANESARDLAGGPRFAAYAAGQAVAVAHVAAHYLGAAAYALKAAGPGEWAWQVDQMPPTLMALILEDQGLRNSICWNVFPV